MIVTQKIVTANEIKLKSKTILPVKHFRNNARTKGSGRTREQSAGPPNPNNVNKTTTGPGHRRTAGEEDRAKAPGRNQPNSPTTAQATCAANSHLGKPKHPVRKHMRQTNAGPTRGKHRRSLRNANPKTPTRKPKPKTKTPANKTECKHGKTVMNCQLSKAGQRFSLFVHWFGLMQKVSKSSAVADVVHIHLSANQLQRLSTETNRVRVRKTSPLKASPCSTESESDAENVSRKSCKNQIFTKQIFHNRQVSQSSHWP